MEEIIVPPQKKEGDCVFKYIKATIQGKSPRVKFCPLTTSADLCWGTPHALTTVKMLAIHRSRRMPSSIMKVASEKNLENFYAENLICQEFLDQLHKKIIFPQTKKKLKHKECLRLLWNWKREPAWTVAAEVWLQTAGLSNCWSSYILTRCEIPFSCWPQNVINLTHSVYNSSSFYLHKLANVLFLV